MLVSLPLAADERFVQPGSRGIVLVGGRGDGQLVLELKTVAPAVVDVEVGQLIVGWPGL
jgi:hypothetical protein